MSPVKFPIGLLVVLLVPCTVHGDKPARPPLVVGILPFERASADTSCHIEARLKDRLDLSGIRVRVLAPSDPEVALTSMAELDFVVAGSLVGGPALTATAKVYARGSDPRSEQFSGPTACEDLVGSTCRKVSDGHAVSKVLETRRQEAEERLRRDPRDFRSLMLLGLTHLYSEDWEGALPYFETAVEVKPNDLDAHLNLALCYKARRDVERWKLHLDGAAGLNPDDEGVLIGLGNYYIDAKDYTRAAAYYEKALSGIHSDVATWNLFVAHLGQGDVVQALSRLNAIPVSSVYYADARVWIRELEERQHQAERRRIAESAPAKSIRELLRLPDSVSVLLVGVAITLFFSPYFGGKKFFNFEIPQAPPRAALFLKVVGPVALICTVGMFPGLVRDPLPPEPRALPVAGASEIGVSDAAAGFLQPPRAKN